MEATITPQAVRAQLARILASEAFARSRRMQRFLAFIVEETLAGRPDHLGEYGIGLAVFDRGADFEPAGDPIVRNDARRLRLKLLEYYRQTPSRPADGVLIDMPRGGYLPVFLPLPSRGVESTPAPLHPRRLAVLPFEVLSEAPEGARYGRALGLSLTAGLTNLDGLEAVAHGYLGDQPIREAATELHLSHVIHGSVWQLGGRCRVIVNLIQVPHGTQMWAREYDVEMSETPAAQPEIAASVLRAVTARLGLPPARPTRLAIAA